MNVFAFSLQKLISTPTKSGPLKLLSIDKTFDVKSICQVLWWCIMLQNPIWSPILCIKKIQESSHFHSPMCKRNQFSFGSGIYFSLATTTENFSLLRQLCPHLRWGKLWLSPIFIYSIQFLQDLFIIYMLIWRAHSNVI